ncbi:MAG: helix-turn-helix domain-containing protein [Thermomicrobiales bacterium]
MSEFGRILAELRAARGWSQARLAGEASVDQSYVSRLEKGERAPERDTVLKLLDALDAPAAERERLLASVGFRSEALDDPLLSDLVGLLIDPALPPETEHEIRTLLRIAVAYGRRAASEPRHEA